MVTTRILPTLQNYEEYLETNSIEEVAINNSNTLEILESDSFLNRYGVLLSFSIKKRCKNLNIIV